jgi:hypothetical protein
MYSLFAATTNFVCAPKIENEVKAYESRWPMLWTTTADPVTYVFTAQLKWQGSVQTLNCKSQ